MLDPPDEASLFISLDLGGLPTFEARAPSLGDDQPVCRARGQQKNLNLTRRLPAIGQCSNLTMYRRLSTFLQFDRRFCHENPFATPKANLILLNPVKGILFELETDQLTKRSRERKEVVENA